MFPVSWFMWLEYKLISGKSLIADKCGTKIIYYLSKTIVVIRDSLQDIDPWIFGMWISRLQARGCHGNASLDIHGRVGAQRGWRLSYWLDEAGEPLPASAAQREVSNCWRLLCESRLNMTVAVYWLCTMLKSFLFFLFWLEKVWKRRDVFGECQKLHSLLPDSRGAKCHHPDELLWGDHCQSLGQSVQAAFVCGRLSNGRGGGVVLYVVVFH